MRQEIIQKLKENQELSREEAQSAMRAMLTGEAKEEDIADYLTALAKKGETVTEITASAEIMREHCYKLPQQPHTMEIVGTGGDKSNTFNISTTSALVLAAAGVPISKHGNRAASSQCGSADVLEALGVNITIPPEKSLELLEKNNICFLFAQSFHPAMKYVAPVRKKLGIRSVFNLLGPLTNPLGAQKQLLGVYDEQWLNPMAEVLEQLGIVSGLVVHGTDGLDEMSLSAPTLVNQVKIGVARYTYHNFTVNPEKYGLKSCQKADLVGGTPQENAEITRRILSGEKFPCRDAVVLNAAAALAVAREQDIHVSLSTQIQEIQEVLDSGKAMKTLENFVKLSNS